MPALRLGAFLGFPGLVFLLVIGAALILGGQELQRRPEFCANCHGGSYEDWRASGAAQNHAVCTECHSGAGVVEALASEFRGGLRIAQFFGGSDPAAAKAEVPNANCVKCHNDRAELVKSHHGAIPAQSGLRYCRDCHAEQIEGQSVLSSRQSSCGKCHSHSQPGGFNLQKVERAAQP